jgi:dienelactone hydrolase
MGMPGTATVIPAGDARLAAEVLIPVDAYATVLFAHGSGSSRHSPRNLAVADVLHRYGLATVLVDLLTPEEARQDAVTGQLRFDIDLLTGRLTGAVDWLCGPASAAPGPVGLFGASTGAAAALRAAAARPGQVPAVVSRGGRPDLTGAALARVRAATLLLVGGRDEEVRRLNEKALTVLPGRAEARVIPGATHLFEEPGALEEVAREAAEWFADHLREAEPVAGKG